MWNPNFPKKNRDVWEVLFVPEQTSWGGDEGVYNAKTEALDVLFIGHKTFPSIGISIMREYIQWNRLMGVEDFRLDSAGKAKAFLEARVNASKDRYRDRKSQVEDVASGSGGAAGGGTLLEECAVYSFRVAVTHLDGLARWQGYIYPLLKTEEIKVLQQGLLKAQANARAAVRDYAATSRFITKRLTIDDRNGIVTGWWTGEAAVMAAKTASGREWAQVRGLLICNLQRSLGRRGADLRSIRLAMLFPHTLPLSAESPVQTCYVLGASLRHVKECHENIEHLLGWARTRDRWECPLGALATYLVYINDIAGSSLIHAVLHNAWHDIMLIQSKDMPTDKPICYTTHNLICHAGMDSAGVVNKTAVTHLDRNTVGCELIEKGVGVNDTGLYQGWYHDTGADIYLRGAFKTDPMLVAHGWDGGRSGYDCWWEESLDIPQVLLDVVFPGLDEALEEVALTPNKKDMSAVQFLKSLQLLRRVYITDAILKQEIYPDFPAYKRHPLFDRPPPAIHTTWATYKAMESSRIAEAPIASRAARQTWVVEAIKATLGEMGGISLATTVATGGGHGRQLQVDMTPPAKEERIPDIREPDDLYSFYGEWTASCRDYFRDHPRPGWDKQFGASARAHKVRFSHIRPYVTYLDSIDPMKVRGVIDKLEKIRQDHGVTPSSFIKYCFYALVHGVCASKPPPILPDALRADMAIVGIPSIQ